MPYYVGIIGDRVESLNTTLPPEEAVKRYIQFEKISAPMSNPTYDNGVFRERTEAEIEAIAQAQARTKALAETKFSPLAVRRALRSLNQETALDALLEQNDEFRKDFAATDVVDLVDSATAAALDLLQIDVDAVKLRIAGIE